MGVKKNGQQTPGVISNTGSTQFPGWKQHLFALTVPGGEGYTTRSCQLSPKIVFLWSLDDSLLKEVWEMRSSASIRLQTKTPICNSINSTISKYTKISTVTQNTGDIYNAYGLWRGSKHRVPFGSIYLVQ